MATRKQASQRGSTGLPLIPGYYLHCIYSSTSLKSIGSLNRGLPHTHQFTRPHASSSSVCLPIHLFPRPPIHTLHHALMRLFTGSAFCMLPCPFIFSFSSFYSSVPAYSVSRPHVRPFTAVRSIITPPLSQPIAP